MFSTIYEGYSITKEGIVYGKHKKPKKTYIDINGYKRVQLSINCKNKCVSIHRLLALTFLPNPNNYPQVDHIDRNKLNNDLSNLRWVNNSTNQQNCNKKKTNTSGYKNISFIKSEGKWKYTKCINGKNHQRRFKTLEEAIEYSKKYL